MPDRHSKRSSSSSSSSSSERSVHKSDKRKSDSRHQRDASRRHRKRSYSSSSEENHSSRKRKDLTFLGANSKYGHRGFVGESSSYANRRIRSRSKSREKYRSRDHRERTRRDYSDRYRNRDFQRYRNRSPDRRRSDYRRRRDHSSDREERDHRRRRDRSSDREESGQKRRRDHSSDREERTHRRHSRVSDRKKEDNRKSRSLDRQRSNRRGRNHSSDREKHEKEHDEYKKSDKNGGKRSRSREKRYSDDDEGDSKRDRSKSSEERKSSDEKVIDSRDINESYTHKCRRGDSDRDSENEPGKDENDDSRNKRTELKNKTTERRNNEKENQNKVYSSPKRDEYALSLGSQNKLDTTVIDDTVEMDKSGKRKSNSTSSRERKSGQTEVREDSIPKEKEDAYTEDDSHTPATNVEKEQEFLERETKSNSSNSSKNSKLKFDCLKENRDTEEKEEELQSSHSKVGEKEENNLQLPIEEGEIVHSGDEIECESADLEELQRLKEQITLELGEEERSKRSRLKKKKKDGKDKNKKEEKCDGKEDQSSGKKFVEEKACDSIPLHQRECIDSKGSKSESKRLHRKRNRSKSGSRSSSPSERKKASKKKESESRHRSKKKGKEEEINRAEKSNERKSRISEDEFSNNGNKLAQNADRKLVEPLPKVELKKPVVDPLSKMTGGAYIPPGRLKLMQEQITDKSSESFQRLSWEALKKSINGIVNKVNISNIGVIVRELFEENIVRGRGLLCRSLMQAQAFSQTFTHVYAALVAAINTKFPQVGELLLNRIIVQFRRGIKRNDKNICTASCKFLAHLVNQQVAHEVTALEILTLLLEKAKNVMDESEAGENSRLASLELTVVFLKECGMKLGELSPKGLAIISSNLRDILHEGKLNLKYKSMVEIMMGILKNKFVGFPAILDDLDLVEESDKITHIIELDGKIDTQDSLNIFKFDPNYLENEAKYRELKAGILGASDDDSSDGSTGSDSGDESDTSSDEDDSKKPDSEPILDRTETNLISFRRTVYLTIQSSLNVDECAHKLLKGEIKPGWEEELCNMIIDCCAQQRTYMKFYGLLAARFCLLNKTYREHFQSLFSDAYNTCHRLEIEKLRNVAKLFSHLLHTDSISWEVMASIQLNEDQSTSSSRVFLKILFEELANFMGLNKLNGRLREPTLAHAFEGLMPRDNPIKTRFAINFFTTIGLGGLTDDLRDFLRSQPKPTAVVAPVQLGAQPTSSSSDSSDDSSTSSSDSDTSDSSDSSSSSSSSSDEDSSSDSDDSSSSSDSSSDSDKGSKSKKKSRNKKTENSKNKLKLSTPKSKKSSKEESNIRVRSFAHVPDKRKSSSSSSTAKHSSKRATSRIC